MIPATARAVTVALTLSALWSVGPARAQPVSTEDKVVRVRVGMQTVPTLDAATHRTIVEQRSFVDFLYRFADNLDVGLALPTMTIHPEFGAANPTVLGFYHLFHQPHWMALRFEFEPPLLVRNHGWRLSLFMPSTLRIGHRIEFFNLPGLRIPIDRMRDTIYSWQTAFLYQFTPAFGIGPSAQIRVTNDGLDEILAGGRMRWEWRDQVRTRAVLYIDLATSSVKPDGQTIAVLAYGQFFIRL